MLSAGSVAKQLHDVVVCRSVEQVGRSSGLQEASLFQHRDAVAELQGFINIVGDHDHGFVETLFETQELALEFVTGDGVERAEWFVEQDDPGVGGEGSRKRDALSLPTGQLNGIPCSKLLRVKMNEVQKLTNPVCSLFGLPSK